TVFGVRPKLYRPAFGVTNPSIGKSVSDLDLTVIGWNRRSLDTTSLSMEKIYGRVVKKLSKGDIVLLHDTSGKTVAVLERLLVFLREKELESVTVDRLLNVKAYV
ncbi:MAG: polysaccharide deacetylase family protein, partial [Flavobacteriaceae bacterium]